MGLPPICQSPLGNGGESNGAGGMRRGVGVESGAGGMYAGVPNCSRNASSRRFKNGSRNFFSAHTAFACSSAVCLGLGLAFDFSFVIEATPGASCACTLAVAINQQMTNAHETHPTFVRLNYSPDSNEANSRDESPDFKRSRIYDIPCTLMMLTRLAVGLEPLNTLDAAHRSPRSVSGIGFPAGPALAGPLSETKNCRNVQLANEFRQIAASSGLALHGRNSDEQKPSA